MGKEIANQVQETQRVPSRINTRQNTLRHILNKLTKVKHKEQILKAARKNTTNNTKGDLVSGEDPFLNHRWLTSFCVLTWQKRGRNPPGSLYKDPNPIHEASPSGLHHLTAPTSSYHHFRGLRFQHVSFGGDTFCL